MAKFALLSSIAATLLLGCQANIEPTYKEKDIPFLVKKICKDEYNLEVKTTRTDTTLWLYAPLPKLLHKDFGIKDDKFIDEEMVSKLSNIFSTIGRVLLSADHAPEFYALIISDINLGIDYSMIGNVMDMKKAAAGFIPETEAARRYVRDLKESPKAIGDTTGAHIQPTDITLPDFLAEQISQRIRFEFLDEGLKNYFKVEKSIGGFSKNVFFFAYSMKQTLAPPKPVDIKSRIMDVIAYVLQTYEYRDFDGIVVTDLATRDRTDISRGAILARPIL